MCAQLDSVVPARLVPLLLQVEVVAVAGRCALGPWEGVGRGAVSE